MSGVVVTSSPCDGVEWTGWSLTERTRSISLVLGCFSATLGRAQSRGQPTLLYLGVQLSAMTIGGTCGADLSGYPKTANWRQRWCTGGNPASYIYPTKLSPPPLRGPRIHALSRT